MISQNLLLSKKNCYILVFTKAGTSPGQVSGVYERCCVLFNIGSLQSHIAKCQNFDSDDGLKNAAKYMQVRVIGYQS